MRLLNVALRIYLIGLFLAYGVRALISRHRREKARAIRLATDSLRVAIGSFDLAGRG